MKLKEYIEKLQVLADNGHADSEVYLTQGVAPDMDDRWLCATEKARGPTLYGYRKYTDEHGMDHFLEEDWGDTDPMYAHVEHAMADLEDEGKLPPVQLFLGIE